MQAKFHVEEYFQPKRCSGLANGFMDSHNLYIRSAYESLMDARAISPGNAATVQQQGRKSPELPTDASEELSATSNFTNTFNACKKGQSDRTAADQAG